MLTINDLKQLNDNLYEIPKKSRSDMRVPARIYASQKLLRNIVHDRSLEQLMNVATLPGIVKYALAMPDIHEGYGFPVGGVAAFDLKDGIISPGGIGYDINCGTRLLRSSFTANQVQSKIRTLAQNIYQYVPSGLGVGGKFKFSEKDYLQVLSHGAEFLINRGYGEKEDLEKIESSGKLTDARADLVSETAKARGQNQLGTMGAGNHFVEVEFIETIFDEKIAENLGIFKNQVVVLIHTGSRGLGHQVATDYIRIMMKSQAKFKIELTDRELACAPFNSDEGQNYFKAMSAAANYAWANRQMITFEIRQAWQKTFGKDDQGLKIVYDVAHNIAKIEDYLYDGRKLRLLIHRKGATRSFPNQPVIIPGSMGTGSYLLVGQEKSLKESFGSTCHGAGRRMSRTQAKKQINSYKLKTKLENMGIVVTASSFNGLAEEAPEAYKDIDAVVGVIDNAGIAKKVARMKPLAVIKG